MTPSSECPRRALHLVEEDVEQRHTRHLCIPGLLHNMHEPKYSDIEIFEAKALLLFWPHLLE
jgi:hypothetical protein